MAEHYLISQIKQVLAKCVGELEDVRRSIADLERHEATVLETLQHVGGVRRFRAPGLAVDGIRPRSRRHARISDDDDKSDGKRQPMTQAVLQALRTQRRPMSAREVMRSLPVRWGSDVRATHFLV